jgi:5-formyltetrahydrofolate cyclo-ligase
VPLPTDVFAEKNALRAVQRRRLAELGAEERGERSQNLLARLPALPAWKAARSVLLFAPLPEEPDLDLLWTNGGLAGKECAYPRVAGKQMQLWRVRSLADLQAAARWGLREPAVEGSVSVGLDECDVVLVPGLAFDRRGARLGRGGGFYDRLLAGRRGGTFLVGVAFAFQIVPEVPVAAHDVIMDAVVTDEEW